ncbi:hypothetical protein BJ165DRAFT_1407732 [Panaeolus papilionaceus]|nr:hypothetical protein BJ165DRAFT_1407732 [Panaeolus papilionaceus]
MVEPQEAPQFGKKVFSADANEERLVEILYSKTPSEGEKGANLSRKKSGQGAGRDDELVEGREESDTGKGGYLEKDQKNESLSDEAEKKENRMMKGKSKLENRTVTR